MENLPPNEKSLVPQQSSLQRLTNTLQLTSKVLAERCPLTMEWWDGLLQYGNLKEEGLEDYTWQHIFLVHLAFCEKGIVLNYDVIVNDRKYKRTNCFSIYQQEFQQEFSTQQLNINQEILKKIHKLTAIWLEELGISILAPLQKLKNLQELWCYDNQLNNLEPLQELKNLGSAANHGAVC